MRAPIARSGAILQAVSRAITRGRECPPNAGSERPCLRVRVYARYCVSVRRALSCSYRMPVSHTILTATAVGARTLTRFGVHRGKAVPVVALIVYTPVGSFNRYIPSASDVVDATTCIPTAARTVATKFFGGQG